MNEKRLPEDEMSSDELEIFLEKHDMSNKHLADLIGISEQAVMMWVSGDRRIPAPMSRLIRYFNSKPSRMSEF